MKLLLLWVAASDGKLEKSELEYVSSQFPDTSAAITTSDFLAMIRNSDLGTIEKSIRMVGMESRELRIAFLDTAIALSMADKDIAIAENHILRFYADALYLGLEILKKRFRAICGMAFPDPGDPGSPAWWEEVRQHETGLGKTAEKSDVEPAGAPGDGKAAGPGMTLEAALAILGVSLNASPVDIERAYSEQTAIFQVQRVEAMGEAAVSVANSRFRKIQQARQLLLEKGREIPE